MVWLIITEPTTHCHCLEDGLHELDGYSEPLALDNHFQAIWESATAPELVKNVEILQYGIISEKNVIALEIQEKEPSSVKFRWED